MKNNEAKTMLGLDVEQIFAEQDSMQKRLNELETEVKQTESLLEQYNKSEHENLKRFFSEGYTTGNPLRDEILKHYGLNKKYVEAIMAFSARLESAKGKEFLLTFTSHIGRCESVYVLGTLSGEPLQISCGQRVQEVRARLPFIKYVLFGFASGHTPPNMAVPGPLELGIGRGEPSAATLIENVIGSVSEHSTIVRIYTDAEIKPTYGLPEARSILAR